jgi:hypothetical protein
MPKERSGNLWPFWSFVTIAAIIIGACSEIESNESGSPSPSPPSIPRSSFSPDLSVLAGHYVGGSINRTFNVKGYISFNMMSVESSGRTRVHIEFLDGLEGIGTLGGTISERRQLRISGPVFTPTTGLWDADFKGAFVSDEVIRGVYRLYPRPGTLAPYQEGEFLVQR